MPPLRIKEAANDRPLTGALDQFIRAQANLVTSKAADEHAVRNSWARQGKLITEAASEIDNLLADEDLVLRMGAGCYARLMDLVARLRRA